jgi:hypothetical protein
VTITAELSSGLQLAACRSGRSEFYPDKDCWFRTKSANRAAADKIRVTQQVPVITSLNNERVGIGKFASPGLVAMLSECTRDRYKSIAEPATGLPSPRPLV